MTDPTVPPSLAAKFRELERRLDALERSPRIPFSSTKGGAFQFLDNNGQVRLAIGNVELDGSIGGVDAAYGILMYDDNGAVTFMQIEGQRGLSYPTQPFPMYVESAAQIITSSTFGDVFAGRSNRPSGDGLVMTLPVVTDANCSGEIRLREDFSGVSTVTATIPANTSGFLRWRWKHPASVGLFDDTATRNLLVKVQARRASGTGQFGLFPPIESEISNSFVDPDITTTGNPLLAT